MTNVRIDGALQGGGDGGGGGGTDWSAEWTTLYDRDFTDLADADVKPGSDGDFPLDGRTVYARAVSRMASLDVGPTAGGLKLGLGAASESADYYGAALGGPAIEWKLSELFAGTDFEGRHDVEMRATWKLAQTGTPNSAVYEYRTVGLRSLDNNTNRRLQILQGGVPGNTDNRQVFTEATGTLAYGELIKDDADLAYTPNVLQAAWVENYLHMTYSPDASGDVGDTDLVSQYAADRTSLTQRLIKTAGAAGENILFFAHGKTGGVAGITSIILVHLRVEARFSPRGLGIFVP